MKRRIVAALMAAVLIGHSGFGLSDYSEISNAADLSQSDIEDSDQIDISNTEQLNSENETEITESEIVEAESEEIYSEYADTDVTDAATDDSTDIEDADSTEDITEDESESDTDTSSESDSEMASSSDYEDIDESTTDSSTEASTDNLDADTDSSSESDSSASSNSSDDSDTGDSADSANSSSTGSSESKVGLTSLNSSTDTDSEEFSYQVVADGYTFDFTAEAGVVPEGASVAVSVWDTETSDNAKESINDTLPRTSTVKDGSYFDIAITYDNSSTASDIESDSESELNGNINVSVTVPDSVIEEDNSSDYIEVIPYDLNSDYDKLSDYTYSDGVLEFDMAMDTDSTTDIAITTIMSIELSDVDSRVNDVYAQELEVEEIDNEVLNARASNLLTLDNMKTSVSDIASELKSQMKNRAGSITVNYSLTGISASALSGIMDDALSIAVQHTGASDEGDYLRWSYSRYSEAFSYTTSGSALVGQMFYTFTYNCTLDQENAVSSLSSKLKLSGMSEAEKVVAVHKYITDNITYDYSHLSDSKYMLKYSCYAAIINKTAVCQGYALLFYRMMLINGIDARLIAGEANGGSHGWNIVKISGAYYNLDSTWDAGKSTSDYDYFLKCNKNFKKHTRWSEYNTSSFNTSYPMSGQDYDLSTLEGAAVTGVKLNKTSLMIKKGKTTTLKATVKPTNAGNTKVTWKSSNKKVATVTSKGKIKAKKAGTCVITVTTKDGGYKAKCYVTVYNKDVKVKKVSLNKKSVTLDVDDKVTLKAKITPTGATNKNVTWKSSNKSIATVSSKGVVTAVGSGTCIITVKTKSGKKKAKCKITVN